MNAEYAIKLRCPLEGDCKMNIKGRGCPCLHFPLWKHWAAPCNSHVCLNQRSLGNHASCLSVSCFSLDLPIATPHPGHHYVRTDGHTFTMKNHIRRMLKTLAWHNRFLLLGGLVPPLPQIFWIKLLSSCKQKAIPQYQNLDLDLTYLEGIYLS